MNVLDLYITKECNLRCEYCYVDVGKDVYHFDVEHFLAKKDLKYYDQIKFFGGEPLLKWKEIQAIVLWVEIHSPHVRFAIITNGTLLNAEKYQFIRSHNISLIISVHRFPGIKKIYETIPQIFATATNVNVSLSFVLTPNYLEQTTQDIHFALEKGASNIILLPDSSILWTGKVFEDFKQTVIRLVAFSLQFPKNMLHLTFTKELVNPTISCKKTVEEVDKIVLCNRFSALKNLSSSFFQTMQESLEQTSFFSHPYRYFFTCPIGFFLDHLQKDFRVVAWSFIQMNLFLIQMQKKIETIRRATTYLTLPANAEIRFNLNTQCNLRCSYCYLKFSAKHLESPTAKHVIDYILAAHKAPEKISFFGGEPLLDFPLLQKIIGYIESAWQAYDLETPSFSLATNGTLLRQEIVDFLFEKKFDIHMSFGGLPIFHNQLRYDSCDRVLQKLKAFSLETYPGFVALLVIHPSTIHRLFDSYIFLQKQGIKKIHFEFVYSEEPMFWQKNHFLLFYEQLCKIRAHDFGEAILYKELSNEPKRIYDVSITGQIAQNSFEFFGTAYRLSYKQKFDRITAAVFSQTSFQKGEEKEGKC